MSFKEVPVGTSAARGIYDCDEAHRTPRKADYERLFACGMVVLDTNVLLNLYRSNERTRQDTLAVLTKLRDRLWVPHQVLTEFWRNREQKSVRHHHSAKAKETSAALDKARRSAQDAVERWLKDVRLKEDEDVTRQIREGLDVLAQSMDLLREVIDGQAQRDALAGTAETHTDPVLSELESLLRGRIGEPLSEDEYDKAVQEAVKRADDEIPPGYEDFRNKPPEQAAGDYLLWVQLLKEAAQRDCDVLLVTGDVKRDWWQPRDMDIQARPRAELVAELREQAGAHLYMLTPAELLTWAEQLLEGLHVDRDSVSDLEQLRDADSDDDAQAASWTRESLFKFLYQLASRSPSRVKVIKAAAENGGFVDRATVYKLAGYAEDRQLKGFTRPISTVERELKETGVLSGEEPFLLRTVYGSATEPSWASGFRIPDEVVPMVIDLFAPSRDSGDSTEGELDAEEAAVGL
ncbi:PIN-like domain-containing protein [Streptomyces vinaceusdrappus]|uniref:PIN-like domain-containing protein n=1 Tax=Streptomyces vinaceusdrappus TaxID=67376 RepID=A0ABY6C5K6_9ACTN|nr:PIN-like domain-containing protein [Streptomyces vinaceusdrappus]UXI81800.1 PIN-like domain-containing protein [Streptomyces vinaceusdrappus]